MSEVNYIGCHARLEDIELVASYFNCFQVLLTSPIKFDLDEVKAEEHLIALRTKYPDKLFVGHSPYWYNILIDNRFYKYSIKHMMTMVRILSKHNCSYYVIHPGSRGRKDATIASQEESMPFFIRTLEKLAKNIPAKFKLLIENVPMSKMDSKGLTIENILMAIKLVNSDRIGFAFDTQHAYCSGEDVTKFMDYACCADVIHLNPNPVGILPRSFRDRHSETALWESEGLSYSLLMNIVSSYKGKIKIIEADTDVAIKDAEELIYEGILPLLK